MTPEMVRRVEFLREAAAQGYSSRWAAGELGLPPRIIYSTCKAYNIHMPRLHGGKPQKTRSETLGWSYTGMSDEGLDACEDFLPDVGEV